jgi:hypothetical protein
MLTEQSLFVAPAEDDSMPDLKTKALAAGVLVALATTSPATAGKNEDAFANAGYNMCDAKLLGAVYNDKLIKRVISDAGEKILEGYADVIAGDLADARNQFSDSVELCPADDYYSSADVAYFARFWDIDSISEAKEKISTLLISGDKADIDEAIEMAK